MKTMLLMLSLLPAAAFAHDYKAGDLAIGHPWTRATPGGSDMAAGYLTVTNTGKVADVLEGAEVNGVDHVMIHTIRDDKGVAHMENLDGGVTVAPGQTVQLAPGGLHLMWMGLKQPLKAGEMVSGTLMFKNAGKVAVGFKVEAAGAKAAGHQH